jgi:CPA1 family monovalent cation:H+ antiporter
VLLLALGLVVLTVVAVGYFIHWLIPSIPLAVAFVLGAIVSPTDAVATVATTATMPLPARVTHIVNAESLLNDATGLVAFKLAVAAAVAAGHTTMDLVTGQFVILSGGGLCVGIISRWLGRKFRERLIRLGRTTRSCSRHPTRPTSWPSCTSRASSRRPPGCGQEGEGLSRRAGATR